MGAARHRVRRQRWLVRLGRTASPAEAFAARARIREAWDEALLPAFERAFDEAAGGEGVLHVPRLELRVRVASLDALPGALSAAVGEALRDAMTPNGAGEARRGPPARGREDAGGRDDMVALLHYLMTGTLFWADAAAAPNDAAAALRATVAREPGRVAAALRGARAGPPSYFRLLDLLDRATPAATPSAVAALSAGLAAEARRAVERLVAADAAARADRHSSLSLAAELLAAGTQDVDLPAAVARTVRQEHRAALGRLIGLTSPTNAPTTAGAPRLTERGATDAAAALDTPNEVRGGGARPEEPPARDAARRHAGGGATLGGGAGEPFPLSAANAGLIVLHPFLPALLANVGAAVGGRVPDDELPRAAAVLHHAATGSDAPHEFELPLVKLLLGLRPDAPLSVCDGLLRPSDVDEIEALLGAVVGHWTALKGTTQGGLRAAFLGRPGWLRREDDGWRLRVEPAAFDVLLDRLPWGVSLVKLPWMPEPLHAEWTP